MFQIINLHKPKIFATIGRQTLCNKTMAKKLTAKELRVAEEYAQGYGIAKAFIRAGITTLTPLKTFNELRSNPEFEETLQSYVSNVTEERKVTRDAITQELAYVAFADITDFYDAQGKLIPIKQLPPHARRAIKSIKTVKVRAGEDCDELVVDGYEVYDKLGALMMLGKSYALEYFKDIKEVINHDDIANRPDGELVSRFIELVRKAGNPAHSQRVATPGDDAKVVNILQEQRPVQEGVVSEAP